MFLALACFLQNVIIFTIVLDDEILINYYFIINHNAIASGLFVCFIMIYLSPVNILCRIDNYAYVQ